MAKHRDHGHESGDEGRHGPSLPIQQILGRLFGFSAPDDGPPMDPKKEKKAFDAAKDTALKVAALLIPAKDRSKGPFIRVLTNQYLVPIQDNPLIPHAKFKALVDALEAKTGQIRESDKGRPPRDEVWGDTLWDAWYNHVSEHIGQELWLRLGGDPKEKEAKLEEMLPVLQKYGPVLFEVYDIFSQTNPADPSDTPLEQASACAGRAIRDMVIAKAQELGIAAG